MNEFRQMLEDSLTAPLRPAAVFEALQQKPAPGYPVMTANLAAFTGAAVAISLAHAAITHPVMMSAGPLALALGALGSLLLFILLSFFGAIVLHVLSRICGGSGDFRRSYQIVSLSSVIACVAALLNWFPGAWALPVLLGAYLSAVGIQTLHQASKARTWAVLAVLTLFSLGGQWLMRKELQKYAGAMALMENAREDLNEMRSAAPQKIDLENMSLQNPETEARVSGMDMVKNSQLQEASASPESASAEHSAPDAADASAMISSLSSMLNNPALFKNMPPEEAAKMKELMEVLNKTQASLKSGKPLSAQETQAMTAKLQRLTMEMMQTLSSAGPGAKPKSKPRQARP